MREIALSKPSQWSDKFSAEQDLLMEALPSVEFKLHHIGSTAIEGLLAKPVIDMIMEVQTLDDLDKESDAMTSLGYECMGEFGIEGRRFFRKGGDDRTHHIHAFETGHPAIAEHLLFRDYMNANPVDAHAYEKLKQTLAEEHRFDSDAYTQGKNAFIKSILIAAELWKDA